METSTTEINQEKKELNPYDLRGAVVEDRWDEVIAMYEAHKKARTIEINNSRGTALHVAANGGNEKVVRCLVEAIIKHESARKQERDDKVHALQLTNERGDTPLHLAASRGFKDICECIIGGNQERKNLIRVKNNEGETPLFLAALAWQKQAFAYLWYVVHQQRELKDNLMILIRSDGDSILHCAIRREFYDLALIIIRCYPKLRDIQNKQGFSPLKVLATRPSAFRSGSKFTWWKQIIYHCIEVEDLDVEKAMNSYLEKKAESGNDGAEMFPENYRTSYEFFTELPHLALTCGEIIIDKKQSYVEGKQKIKILEEAATSNEPEMKGKESTVPENYASCSLLAKLAYMHTLGLSGVDLENMGLDFELRVAALENEWHNVIAMYKTNRRAHRVAINKSRGTALHVAVNNGKEDDVKSLVEAIMEYESSNDDDVKALELRNDQGDTALHLAARRGFKGICGHIIGKNREREYLVHFDNYLGETPVFLAAITRRKKAFAYFCTEFHHPFEDLFRYDGDTILHIAIRREFFDLALIILHKYPNLRYAQDNKGYTPLETLATKPSAFKSGSQLTWWKHLIYCCIDVEELVAEKALNLYLGKKDEPARKFLNNCLTRSAKIKEQQSSKNAVEESNKGDHGQPTVPKNYATCHQFAKLANYATCHLFAKLAYMFTLILSAVGINSIRNMRQRHKWGDQLLTALFMDSPSESYMGGGAEPELEILEPVSNTFSVYKKEKEKEEKIDMKETAFLIAAKNGIVEMVAIILSKIPSALHDTTSDKQNVFHVAVINRQPLVVEKLRNLLRKQDRQDLTRAVDNHENTILHLAAIAKESDKGWKIAGSALQMMWDIKWFQYIKDLVPDHFISVNEKEGNTPGEIFRTTHKELIQDSNEWLKDTAESCSVVAALIAGVSFATATTIPGGTIGDTGKPTLEGERAFEAFAIASLVGLCLSVTALIMFLSILTSRKHAKDFRIGLPRKLLLGLSSLFVSIVAMFVSFCSGHFFLLKDKFNQTLFPVYVATCLPVIFYARAQFPLYLDLLQAFLKKMPPSRDMIGDV